MEKQKITQISSFTKDREGNPLKTKDGREYTRLVIRTDRHGDKQLSGFAGKATSNWKEGSEIEIEVTETTGKDGKTYYNFKALTEDNKLELRIKAVEGRLDKIESYLKAKPLGLTSEGVDGEVINASDIPF